MGNVRAAIPSDVPAIVQLIRDLAEYEHLLDDVQVTESQMVESLFCATPAVFAHVVEHEKDGETIVGGYALWFLTFSTWLGKHGIYLEDLYIHPELRGQGYGTALITELAHVCAERGYGRFEWSVLDWNESSIAVYTKLGAVPMDGWTMYRLTGESLSKLGDSH